MTKPTIDQLTTVIYRPVDRIAETTTQVQIFKVGPQSICVKTAAGWPFVIDRDRLVAIAGSTDTEAQLDDWCPVTTLIDCRHRSCELHYMAAPLDLGLTVKAVSVRDNDDIKITDERFPTVEAVQAWVPRELRGISSYWQVRVYDPAGNRIGRMYRNGPNGTGEQWTWEPAAN